METKVCSRCKLELSLDQFYRDFRVKSKISYLSICKKCNSDYSSKRYSENKKHCLKVQEEYRNKNKDKLNEYFKEYRKEHKEERRLYQIDKLNNDIQFKIARNIRRRTSLAIKNNQKSGSSIKDLGCSVKELKQWFEQKFQPGMTWENYGSKWHIDHIKPLVLFNLEDREQFLEACNYKNLQPLWAKENLRKGKKYDKK